MNYLYHAVPRNMQGDVLYPLNTLKEKYPEIYKRQIGKYVGREHVTEQRIPFLNCLWNDVLHFSPVNPKELKQALVEAGRSPDFTMTFYQIHPNLIDPKHTIVYLYPNTNKDQMSEENFVPYAPEDVSKFSLIPQASKDYYREMFSKGERPLFYHRIPHILYKGELNIADVAVVTV